MSVTKDITATEAYPLLAHADTAKKFIITLQRVADAGSLRDHGLFKFVGIFDALVEKIRERWTLLQDIGEGGFEHFRLDMSVILFELTRIFTKVEDCRARFHEGFAKDIDRWERQGALIPADMLKLATTELDHGTRRERYVKHLDFVHELLGNVASSPAFVHRGECEYYEEFMAHFLVVLNSLSNEALEFCGPPSLVDSDEVKKFKLLRNHFDKLKVAFNEAGGRC